MSISFHFLCDNVNTSISTILSGSVIFDSNSREPQCKHFFWSIAKLTALPLTSSHVIPKDFVINNYAAQVAIVKEMTGRNRAAQLEIVKQMSRQ